MLTLLSVILPLSNIVSRRIQLSPKVMQQPSTNTSRPVVANSLDLRDSLTLLTRVDQEHHFAIEIRILRNIKPIPATSKLATLTPFIDASGMIRLGDRIQYASLPEDTNHPMVLSSDS